MPTTATGKMGHTLFVTHRNTWRIYDTTKREISRQHLEHYYSHEDASTDRTCTRLQTSFPYHHCLIKASHHSSQTVLDAQCLYPFFKTKNKKNDFTNHIDSVDAVARVHENEDSKTPFTEITAFQKTHLIAQSAMTGLLISRLFKISSAKPWTIQCSKKHADLTAKYIHSALASEALIGRRYYYNLPTVIQSIRIVGYGHSPDEQNYRNIKAEDATFEKIKETRRHLAQLYNSNIERLEDVIKQFRRGFLSIQTIREDFEFEKMIQVFWLLQAQCMKYRDVVTSGLTAHQALCERNNIAYDSKSINIMVCNLVFSCQAVCPRLFSYDIAHLFDNITGSYARYVKTTKAKHLELCNQGLTSGFLTFAAIEPNLVSMHLAPHIEDSRLHSPSNFSSYAFHIPSRDTVFGSLVSKHRDHILRPVEIERTFFMTRNNKDCFYLPVQEALNEMRTGKKSAKELWKKNKINFKENPSKKNH